jgi:hypothetical protein
MRAIKKIAALATGTLMVGATILGAMAADLADYPKPLFIKDGKFDGAIVVGDKAAAEDVVGAIDIATSLQYSSTTTTTTTGVGTTVTAEGEAHKIEKDTNKLNLGEAITDIQTAKIDVDDLPMVLADGTYRNDEGKEFDYEQTIQMSAETFTCFADNDYMSSEPTIGLHYDDGDAVLVYELDFTTSAESDITDGALVDFEDTTITIMGKQYEIVDTDNGTCGTFELMGGAIKDSLEEGETKTYTLNGKEYEVIALIISDAAPESCKLKINGEVTDKLEEDDTYKLADGTEVGIRSIMSNEAGEVTGGDIVEFYLGAQKMTLKHSEELELGDEDVDGLIVDLSHCTNSAEYELSSIQLNWTTEDELFVTEESSAILPGLETVELTFAGMTVPGEEIIRVENDGDQNIVIVAPIKGDDSYELGILHDNETGIGFSHIGEDTDKQLLTTTAKEYVFDKDDHQFMVVSNDENYETYLIKATTFDDTDGVDFEDAISGAKYEKKADTETFDVGDITFTVNDFNKTAKWVNISTTSDDFNGDVWYTPEGLQIDLPTSADVPGITYEIVLTEAVDDDDVTGKIITVTVGSNHSGAVDKEAQVDSLGGNFTEIDEVAEDEMLYYVLAGEVNSKAVLDSGPDQPKVIITYPGGESYGNLFIAETGVTFGTTITTTAGGVAVEKIEVGTAKLASEIADVSAQNLIVVGGPCANDVAAEVMGVAATIPECLAGFEEGKAMIKLYNTGAGKVAMLVAGATAMDTRRASRVVANSADYALSGDEVEVTGTSLTNVQVTKVE